MRKIIFVLIGVLALASCNNENKALKDQEAVFISIENFETAALDLVDQKIALEGLVNHVCKHGGKRFFLGEERIKILASDKIGSFDVALEGSDVLVEGILREERVDEDFLIEWEAELDESTKVREKELEHKGEPGHDHDEGENAEDPNAGALKQIKDYREQLADTGKEYLSFFTVEVLSLEEKK